MNREAINKLLGAGEFLFSAGARPEVPRDRFFLWRGRSEAYIGAFNKNEQLLLFQKVVATTTGTTISVSNQEVLLGDNLDIPYLVSGEKGGDDGPFEYTFRSEAAYAEYHTKITITDPESGKATIEFHTKFFGPNAHLNDL